MISSLCQEVFFPPFPETFLLSKSGIQQTTAHGPNLAHHLLLSIKFYWNTVIVLVYAVLSIATFVL